MNVKVTHQTKPVIVGTTISIEFEKGGLDVSLISQVSWQNESVKRALCDLFGIKKYDETLAAVEITETGIKAHVGRRKE